MDALTVREMIFAPIAEELAEVERRLQVGLVSRVDLISRISSYVLGSGGKRIRPALLLLSGKLCGYQGGRRDIELASVAEYMHVATLIHDDIIDNAEKRRGLPSAPSLWGPTVSVLVGDFLYARSIQMLVEDGDFEILRTFADATVRMAEGEILELDMAKNVEISEEAYFEIVTSKTAALISAACRAGALIAEAPADRVAAMTDFGLNLGIGFQLVDDALDYVAHEERLGKPVGSDFREGKVTYPIIHVVRVGSAAARDRVRALAARGHMDDADLAELKALVERYDAVQATMERVQDYLLRARQCLGGFPDSPPRQALEVLVDFVRERDW